MNNEFLQKLAPRKVSVAQDRVTTAQSATVLVTGVAGKRIRVWGIACGSDANNSAPRNLTIRGDSGTEVWDGFYIGAQNNMSPVIGPNCFVELADGEDLVYDCENPNLNVTVNVYYTISDN